MNIKLNFFNASMLYHEPIKRLGVLDDVIPQAGQGFTSGFAFQIWKSTFKLQNIGSRTGYSRKS